MIIRFLKFKCVEEFICLMNVDKQLTVSLTQDNWNIISSLLNQHFCASSKSPSPHVHTSNFNGATNLCPSPLATTAITTTACFTALQQQLLLHSASPAAAAQSSSGGQPTQRSSGGGRGAAQHAAIFSMLPRFVAQRALKQCMGRAGPGVVEGAWAGW
jgi:hypothetical protein